MRGAPVLGAPLERHVERVRGRALRYDAWSTTAFAVRVAGEAAFASRPHLLIFGGWKEPSDRK
jgi:hypothetical protein